ncbi:MAG: adenylosuccinate lyase, partial [Alphaproteobacteria bacterium]
WREGGDFLALLKSDKQVTGAVPAKQLAELFDLSYHTKHVDRIFSRVFGD